MSRASKITLGVSLLTTSAIIFGVHYVQEADKQAMHQGVLSDEARQRARRERQIEFDQQRRLEEALLQEQTVTKQAGG
ncbi:hypothetical protein PYCC9005_003393 [Savitreella phatthalungensis]